MRGDRGAQATTSPGPPFTRAVPKALGHEVAFNVEIAEDPDQNLCWAQGVSAIGPEGERLWIARIYARHGDGRFWLMHWNGAKENLELIARIFVTFDPEESSFRSED